MTQTDKEKIKEVKQLLKNLLESAGGYGRDSDDAKRLNCFVRDELVEIIEILESLQPFNLAATDKITFEEVTLLKVKKLHEFVTCLTAGRRERKTAIVSDLVNIINED